MTRRRSLNVALMLESDGPGGAEWMLLHLATELRRRGHTILPVGPDNGVGWLADEFRKRSFEPVTYRLRRPIDPGCVRSLYGVLRRFGADVVHSHEFTMAFYGGVAAALLRRPHVVTMHGGTHYADAARRRIAMRWALGRAARAVAVSGSTRDLMCKALDMRPSSIDIVWNGVPEPAQSANREETRRKLGLTATDVFALAVGNLYPVKGHAYLAEAVARIGRDAPDVPLRVAVAGRGEEQGRLDAYIREHALGDRFRLLGFRDDVPALLDAADIYVMPSLSEGLPLALAEAMLAGKPIIASGVGGIPEVIRDGQDGMLVPAGDAGALADILLRLARDGDAREELGRNARAKALDTLTVARMTDRYEDIYRAALSGPI